MDDKHANCGNSNRDDAMGDVEPDKSGKTWAQIRAETVEKYTDKVTDDKAKRNGPRTHD